MPRPRLFPDLEEFEILVDGYFADCEKKKKRPNHIGLANHLGVLRRTLNDYSRKEGYSEVLEMAKQLIEEQRVDMLFDGKAHTAGVIFDLVNNYGWKNPAHREHTGPGGGPIHHNHTSKPMPADVQNEIDAHKQEMAGE